MLGDLLDLVLPQRCGGCDAPGAVLCAGCTAELCWEPRARMPSPSPPGLPECWSAAVYEGAVRRAIIAYKERGRTALARPLARAVAATIAAAAPEGPVVVVPVPSARSARRSRGHDPVGRLAALAVRELAGAGRSVALAAVVGQRRRVADQAGLSHAERAVNQSAAYRVGGRHAREAAALWARSWPVVLVDDIVTSGATLAESAAALRGAGAEVRHAVTLAATPRRTGGRGVADGRVVRG
ncbi:phosphoribosyltransferase family protein [Streptosporangium soli]|nr:ComF family protein [Streptosporangium sp. KLBMP 9127]